ncbi:sensor histidine kinase [Polaribacter atrinae]|uniref:sensor histidine kinase n=1 Tax=Polaribacter atrinae TaxID=1333662 RepID=UPI00249032E8|nr:ATP-binding protein [Polaribacter atrinae]
MKFNVLFLFLFIFLINNKLFSFQEKSTNITYDSIAKTVVFYSKKRDNKKALFYSKKMLQKSLNNKNEKQKAESYYRIAQFQRKLRANDSAFYFYNKSKELYRQQNDSIQIARCLRDIAIIESSYGNYINSNISAINGLEYLKGRNASAIASIYNTLAINSKKQNLFKQAIYNYKQALTFISSTRGNIVIKNNMANVYKEQKEYSKSISILEELLKGDITSQKSKARIIDNLAHIKWLNNPNINILKDLLLAKSIRVKEKDTYGLIASYSHLSDFFYKKNRSKSLFYADKMYEVSKKEKSPQDQIEAIDKIIGLQTAQKAINYYKESIRLRDSLQEVESKHQYKFATIKYNYEEEEKQKLKFQTLATENILVAEKEKSQKKNVLIIGFLSISSLLFLIYRRKEQHKKRILQENYNTETRIAKKLHDELGNDIFNTLTKVQNTKINTEEIINDLDKIYLQTRAISHENDSIETGSNFENYFRNLVASYNSDACKFILKDLSSLDLNNLNKSKQIVMYRVFNELFVNMKKHSQASLVVLSCKKTNHNLEISYADNGVGFKDNTIIFKNGLKNMETRIKTINGTINFENKPNKGLKVYIHFKN